MLISVLSRPRARLTPHSYTGLAEPPCSAQSPALNGLRIVVGVLAEMGRSASHRAGMFNRCPTLITSGFDKMLVFALKISM